MGKQRKTPKELLFEGVKRLVAWLKAKRNAARTMTAFLAAAAVAATAIAGVVAVQKLNDRVTAVEDQPGADLSPLEATSADLGRKVAALSARADQLARDIRALPTPGVPSTAPPVPVPPVITGQPGASTESVRALAGDLASTADALAALGEQVTGQAAQQRADTTAQARALAELAAKVATTAKALQGQVDAVADQTAAALEQLKTQAAALAALASDLSGVSARLDDLVTEVAAQADRIAQASADAASAAQGAQDAQTDADAALSTAQAARTAADAAAQRAEEAESAASTAQAAADAAQADAAAARDAVAAERTRALAAEADAQAQADLARSLTASSTTELPPPGTTTVAKSIPMALVVGAGSTPAHLLTATMSLTGACTVTVRVTGVQGAITLTTASPAGSLRAAALTPGNKTVTFTVAAAPAGCTYGTPVLVAQRLATG